jgi:hypothetical protein
MAWSRSARMSRMSSMPTERRTSSGVTPVVACSSTVSCWWVVEAGWMTSDFAVADVGDVGEELQRVDELLAGFVAALDAEGDSALGRRGDTFGAGVVLAGLEAGVVDPLDAGMGLEMRGDGEGVLRVALHAQVEGFDSLQEQEGVEGREGRAGVAQALDAGFEDEGERAEGCRVGEAVVGGIGLGEVGEAAGGLPVELAGVDDDAADGGAVAADELGGGVDDDVGAPLDGADEGRGCGRCCR